ncbi:MAG: hypothetical protein C4518_04020 [Desulfobacteraceae bacterium]|nr:MAG: hypothetical protein C4518_04020 [Desulfobacteraceae bacterium]
MPQTAIEKTLPPKGKTVMDPDFRIDFIGIGAPKSGTTWLADCLRRHPQIFVPEQKELMYFNSHQNTYDIIKNYRYGKPLQWYHGFFKDAGSAQIKGEITPSYLEMESSAEGIYNYHPGIKLIVILRDPVEKAYSLYRFYRQKSYIKYPAFREAIEKAPFLLDNSRYYMHLKRYFDLFPRENILVLYYEDLKRDSKKFIKAVENFLGVQEFYPDNLGQRSNETTTVRIEWVNRMLKEIRARIHKNNLQCLLPLLKKTGVTPLAEYIRDTVNARKSGRATPLDPELQQHLRGYFKEEIENLEGLLETDLSRWK